MRPDALPALIAFGLLAALTWTASGQESGQTTGDAASQTLAGPAVSIPSERATLVEWSYDGRLNRLKEPPEIAALSLLDLSVEEQAEVDRVVAERTAVVDAIVLSSISQFQRLDGARVAGDYAQVGRSLSALAVKLKPLTERGSLSSELVRVLSPQHATQMATLTTEYHRAVMRDERIASEREGRKFSVIEALAKSRAEALTQAIERSLERTLVAEGDQFEILMQRVGFRPETEQMVRAKAQEFIERTEFNPTKEQQEAFLAEVFLSLDREERVKALTALFQISREQRQMRRD
jgi:hypothetical protein